MAHRKYGIGADQVIVIHALSLVSQDVSISIINSDGSTASICINGLLCLGFHLKKKHPHFRLWRVSIEDKNVWVHVAEKITITLHTSNFFYKKPQSFLYQNDTFSYTSCWVGNPHVLVFCAQDPYILTASECKEMQAACKATIQSQEDFNFSLVYIKAHNVFRLRTFERGAGETDACGSAAVACVYAYNALNGSETECKVYPFLGHLDVFSYASTVSVSGAPSYIGYTQCDWKSFEDNMLWLRTKPLV